MFCVQLGPVLELWQQLSSSAPGLLNKKGAKESSVAGGASSGGPATGGSKKAQDPLDDFVNMEYELAGDLCTSVDGALAALKKVE